MAIYWTTDGHGTVTPGQSFANLGQARLPSDSASPQENAPSERKAASTTKTASTANDEDNHRARRAVRQSHDRQPKSHHMGRRPPTYDCGTAALKRRPQNVVLQPCAARSWDVSHASDRTLSAVPFVRVIIIRPPRCGAAAAGPWMQTRARGRAPCRRADRLSGPFHRYGEAPRASRRPPHKARGGNIPGVFDRRATPGAGCIGGRMPAYL